MNRSGLPLIAVLCLAVAAMTVTMAAPTKRLATAVLVGVPFGILAVVALRRYLHDRQWRLAHQGAVARDQTTTDLIPDPNGFIRDAFLLASAFRTWAGTQAAGAEPSTVSELEGFALRYGDQIDVASPRFLEWVAAYGEARRRATRGTWAVARLVRRGEPVVVSGRFPFLRHGVVLEAIQTLEAAADAENV